MEHVKALKQSQAHPPLHAEVVMGQDFRILDRGLLPYNQCVELVMAKEK